MNEPIFQRNLIVNNIECDWGKCVYDFEGVTITLRGPNSMWSGSLGKYTGYCTRESNTFGSMIVNETVEVTVYQTEAGDYRVDIRLLHMKNPWLSIYCHDVTIKEDQNET